MGAKTVQISDDDGDNFYTLPGNTADFTDTAGSLDDTIFGQDFKSTQSNLIDWVVTANALYKGFAGYNVVIKQSGSTTAFTGEATTHLTGKAYQITNAVKEVFDHTGTFVVYDDAIDHTADVLSIDYLFGIVTFKSAYTVTGPVTIDGKYFPMAALAKYQKYSLTQSQSPIDNTDIPTVQANGGQNTYAYGLKTIALEVDGVYSITNGYRAQLAARAEMVIEICPDGGGKSVARGFFKPTSRKQSGNVGALEDETVKFELSVPVASLLTTPFRWNFTSSDLSTSVQKALNAFLSETVLNVNYLPDGGSTSGAGLTGECIVADISLAGGIDAMNEYSLTLQGTGAATPTA